MEKIKIAITGIGGGVGQSILKSLHDPRFTVVGLDADYQATGLYSVPIAYTIPQASSPAFIDTLLSLCKKERVDFLFPGLDSELMQLAKNSQRFAKIGTRVVISSPKVIEIADNKYETYRVLKEHGIAVPNTIPLDDYLNGDILPFPLVLKPIAGGSRSINVFVLKNNIELKATLSLHAINSASYILQEYIDGDEYTCGSINFNGTCFGVIIMKRIIRSGDTYKCFTIENRAIESTIRNTMSILKPFGACNVQLRLKNGIPTIFEINARCSGTTAARASAGFNEPEMIIGYLSRGEKPKYQIKQISIFRYWKELVIDNNQLKQMELEGKNSNPSFVTL